MMFRGVEFIRYFNQKTGVEIILDEGIDFDIDYGEDGQSISLTFKTKTTSASGAKLNHAPQIGDQFIIEYQHTPDEALDPGDIKNRNGWNDL